MGNEKFVQVKGPFAAGEEVVNRIKAGTTYFNYIKKIGIQTDVANKCTIQEIDVKPDTYEIGKTGMLEFDNVEIISLKFLQDEPEATLVDCIIE